MEARKTRSGQIPLALSIPATLISIGLLAAMVGWLDGQKGRHATALAEARELGLLLPESERSAWDETTPTALDQLRVAESMLERARGAADADTLADRRAALLETLQFTATMIDDDALVYAVVAGTILRQARLAFDEMVEQSGAPPASFAADLADLLSGLDFHAAATRGHAEVIAEIIEGQPTGEHLSSFGTRWHGFDHFVYQWSGRERTDAAIVLEHAVAAQRAILAGVPNDRVVASVYLDSEELQELTRWRYPLAKSLATNHFGTSADRLLFTQASIDAWVGELRSGALGAAR